MPYIRVYNNGVTSGKSEKVTNKKPPKRGEAKGWTVQVSSRLRKWLYSIPLNSLTGQGLAFTLTVRDCPPTADDWADLRDRFLTRLMANSCVRVHWLTEWQKRGVPHLHGVAYWADASGVSNGMSVIYSTWLRLAKKYGCKSQGQNVKLIDNARGWLEYLAKHAARSVRYYQRSADNIPEGWKSTGRMWGYRGQWEVRKPMKFYIDETGFFVYRRLAARWWRARQAELEMRAVKKAMCGKKFKVIERSKFPNKLKCGNPEQSRFMGTSDWLDINTSTRILVWLGSQGYDIKQLD